MEGHTEPDRLESEPDAVIDLERKELLMLLSDVQESGIRRSSVDLDRKGLLGTLRDVQDEPGTAPATIEDDNFLWLG